MKFPILLSICFCIVACATHNSSSLTKDILSQELKNNHKNENWYVPLGLSIASLTEAQVDWKDSLGNHSIRELASHLAFWNERILASFRGDSIPDFNGNNEITFTKFDTIDWNQAVEQLDRILVKWEESMETVTKAQLENCGSEIASMSSHNAYHTGQIIYIRKINGWWKNSPKVK